jgi:hypothetical protein
MKSCRPRYSPFSHRLTFNPEVLCNTWNLSNLSNSLSNDLTNGQGIRLFIRRSGVDVNSRPTGRPFGFYPKALSAVNP